MNKIGPSTTQTAPENKNSKAAVVTQFNSNRRSVPEASTQKSSATVALSNQAVDLSALESRIQQLPDIDSARVVELHNRIISGEDKIDSASIASKMLSIESDLDR